MATFTIKTNVTVHDVVKMFNNANRGDNFSYDGIEAILSIYEDVYGYEGGAFDLDIIATCCEFTESTPEELLSDYDYVCSEGTDEAEKLDYVLDYLTEHTHVQELDNGNYLYSNF